MDIEDRGAKGRGFFFSFIYSSEKRMICQVYLDDWHCRSDTAGPRVCAFVCTLCVSSICRFCSIQWIFRSWMWITYWYVYYPSHLVSLFYRQLCLDLVPRREFSMVDPDEISVTELYRLVNRLTPLHVIYIHSPLGSRAVKCGWITGTRVNITPSGVSWCTRLKSPKAVFIEAYLSA